MQLLSGSASCFQEVSISLEICTMFCTDIYFICSQCLQMGKHNYFNEVVQLELVEQGDVKQHTRPG